MRSTSLIFGLRPTLCLRTGQSELLKGASSHFPRATLGFVARKQIIFFTRFLLTEFGRTSTPLHPHPQCDAQAIKSMTLQFGCVQMFTLRGVLVELVRHNSSLVADTIFSCTRLYVLHHLGETSVRVPGSKSKSKSRSSCPNPKLRSKSNDNCFWSSDQTLDRAIRKWDTISVPFLVTNACRMQHERQKLLEHGNRSLARVRPMHDFLKGCDTYAVPHQWDVCSHLHGCLPEDILYIAINLTHLKARNLPAAA